MQEDVAKVSAEYWNTKLWNQFYKYFHVWKSLSVANSNLLYRAL